MRRVAVLVVVVVESVVLATPNKSSGHLVGGVLFQMCQPLIWSSKYTCTVRIH